MEKFWAPETFALFLAFFVPGFVMSTVWSLIVPTERTGFGKDLPRLVGYSALHYAGTLWIALSAPAGSARLIAAYAVVLALPACWPPRSHVEHQGYFRRRFRNRVLGVFKVNDNSIESKARTIVRRRFPENGDGFVESDTVDRSVLPNFNGRPNWNRRPTHFAAREQPEKPQE